MLQIKDIRKEYKTGPFIQRALDGVSLNLRDNEFVAILGPSGSGKTTLLNVIGGLDRYDSGDLVINGVSTKKYKDRDWDSYRNHSVGFVFQTYNLIPHQTVRANVELALTISGISKAERRKRAEDALTKVGLSEHMHKKPNQLSGGQMQRVAIARALVNDPDILLADEPTGALDSDTSVQVMELLKEVARDRLVVMVTHNPELAEKYATRVVELRDGRIISDNNPLVISGASDEGVHRNLGKASMGFLTALGLSFNNLRTKLTRTILVAFAGSIGIIGIALILSLSNGVDKYIKSIEEDTLREYPLMIENTSFDSSIFLRQGAEEGEEEKNYAAGDDRAEDAGESSSGENNDGRRRPWSENAEVKEMPILTGMFSMLDSNDLKSLREYIESGKTDIYDHTRAIEYSYNVVPQIFREETEEERKTVSESEKSEAEKEREKDAEESDSDAGVGDSDSDGEADDGEEGCGASGDDGEDESTVTYRQINPDRTMDNMGFSYSIAAIGGAYMNSNVFHELPESEELYREKYELAAGHWPERYNELVLVLTENGFVSDMTLYALGLKNADDLDDMVHEFAEGNTVDYDAINQIGEYKYDDFIGRSFKLVKSVDFYKYDETYEVWTDKRKDKKYVNRLAAAGEDLTIVGVIKPKPDVDFTILSGDIYYPKELTKYLMEAAKDERVVKTQLNDRKINVITGKPFGEEADAPDLSELFSVDESAIENAFKVDTSALEELESLGDMTMPSMTDMPKLEFPDIETKIKQLQKGFNKYMQTPEAAMTMSQTMIQAMQGQDLSGLVDSEMAQKMINDLSAGFYTFLTAEKGKSMEEAALIMAALQNNDPGSSDPLVLEARQLYSEYMETAEAQAITAPVQQHVIQEMMKAVNESGATDKVTEAMITGYDEWAVKKENKNKYPTMASLQKDMETMAASLAALAELSKQMSDMSNLKMPDIDFENMFSFDADAFANAFDMNMDEDDLADLFSSLMNVGGSSYSGNLAAFGYADPEEPYSIYIYAKNFESKDRIKEIISDYNDAVKAAGDEDKAIVYTDIVAALMSSVTSILNAISYVLIAFVSISLIVSSIMIGVITYISVLERRKEIGILRAIGASKRNISNVFNAETFIIGALAGIFGIGITLLLLIPGNALITALTDKVSIRAALPPGAGIVLIILSIILTLIGGIIPSRKAAKSDPVTALRTE